MSLLHLIRHDLKGKHNHPNLLTKTTNSKN